MPFSTRPPLLPTSYIVISEGTNAVAWSVGDKPPALGLLTHAEQISGAPSPWSLGGQRVRVRAAAVLASAGLLTEATPVFAEPAPRASLAAASSRRCGCLTSAEHTVRDWQAELARSWATAHDDDWATLAVDGHVKVYTGRNGRLPKHFVARQKLCLPASVSYWVNAPRRSAPAVACTRRWTRSWSRRSSTTWCPTW